MFIRSIAFLFLAPVVLAQQPTPIVPDPKLTPGDSFAVTVQDLCVTRIHQKGAERSSENEAGSL
jgi:hypothetical protein